MEALAGVVGRVCDVLALGVPVRIDAESQGAVGLCVVCVKFPLQLEQRGAVVSTDMQAVLRGFAPVRGMAVHAAGKLGVLDESLLLEGSKFTLVDAHLAVHFVSGLEEPVCQAVVDVVLTYGDGPGFIKDCAADCYLRAARGLEHALPLLLGNADLDALDGKALITKAESGDCL